MSETKVPYPIVSIDPAVPINELPWFIWLKEYQDVPDVFHTALLQYLEGFDVTKHTIESEQIDRHRHVFQHFHWLRYHHPDSLE